MALFARSQSEYLVVNCQSYLCVWHQVVVLRSLRSKLSEALAELHSTTSALHLRVAKHEDADSHTVNSSGAGDGNHTEQLFPQARQAIVQTCNSCSKVFLTRPAGPPCVASCHGVSKYMNMASSTQRSIAKPLQVEGLCTSKQ